MALAKGKTPATLNLGHGRTLRVDPIIATCGRCGGNMLIWPDPLPKGTAVCYGRCAEARDEHPS